MTPARDICDLLVARTNDGRNAFAFVEALFTQIIARLRRDSRPASAASNSSCCSGTSVVKLRGSYSTRCVIEFISMMWKMRCAAA